jgi:hypothetical protein
VLVVQGARDAFGVPPEAPGRTLVTMRGDHALRADLPGLATAVTAWLPSVLSGGRDQPPADAQPAIDAKVAPVRRARSAGASSTSRPRRPALQ